MKSFLKIFGTVLLVSVCAVSCTNSFCGGSKVSLRLPYFSSDSLSSRNAEDDSVSYNFKVSFASKSGTYVQNAAGRSGETLEFPVPEGEYMVGLEALDSAGAVCYEGTGEAVVVADETTEVEISLKKAFVSQSEHLKVETCADGIKITVLNIKETDRWVNLDDRNAGIRIADFDPNPNTENTFVYPITEKGRRYDILCELVDDITGKASYETVSAIAGGGDPSLMRWPPYSMSASVDQNGTVGISRNPVEAFLSSDLSKYGEIFVRLRVMACRGPSEYEWEKPLADVMLEYDAENRRLTPNDTRLDSVSIGDFVKNGYSLRNVLGSPENGELLQLYRYGFADVELRIRLGGYSTRQTISNLGILSPIIGLPEVNGNGGDPNGGNQSGNLSPNQIFEYDVDKENLFIQQIQSVNSATATSPVTITLTDNLYIKTPINTSSYIIIDGQNKYGIVLDVDYDSQNAGTSFENVKFINGAGATDIENAKRFGMIYWCGDGNLSFRNCTFESNQTRGDISGGAIALFGSTNTNTDQVGVSITDCIFNNNTASTGAAIDIGSNDKVTISNCRFIDNNGQNDIFCGSSSATVSGSGNSSSRSNSQNYSPYGASSNRDSSLNPDTVFWTTSTNP
ncbi:MAG: right-handed parallel beta-helix repeat-containing protein [Treponema sp.]|nr:right-handed parallel beta-helix repeat-containing protein [Treponema sp.]